MKKKIIARGALGFPLGIAIGYIITIGISLIWAEGYYSPCVPELISMMGNEIRAVIVQALLSGLLGAGCSAGSVIWEIEKWSMAKQTGIYFGIVSVIMMPIAYALYWMEHTIRGFVSYFGIFLLIFIIVWVVQFFAGKYVVKQMNRHLHKTRNE